VLDFIGMWDGWGMDGGWMGMGIWLLSGF